MDPLSALSVAACVAQFADFGSRLLSRTVAIYKSPSDEYLETVGISKIATDLDQLCKNVETEVARLGVPRSRNDGTSSGAILLQICRECRQTHDKFREVLQEYSHLESKRGDGFDFRRVETSLVMAFKQLRSFKVDVWRARFTDLRERMRTAVMAVMWEQSVTATQELADLSSQQAKLTSTLNELEKDKRSLNQTLIQLLNGSRQVKDPKHNDLISKIWSTSWTKSQAELVSQALDGDSDDESNMRRRARDLSDETSYVNAITASLRFRGVDNREVAIPKAYEATCEWVYTEPRTSSHGTQLWHSFPQWLQNDAGGVYWVTGKPGAGKSTLMKYVIHDKRTKAHLRNWSEGLPLIRASFYFWNSGSRLQKSQEGLLRRLLGQCLDQMPNITPKICPRRWAIYRIFGSKVHDSVPEWTWAELLEGFSALNLLVGQSFKIALFIDGLDEFDGDHQKLVEFVQLFQSRAGAKICVSSRPWNVFMDAFLCSPSLEMQEFTTRDIEIFVKGQFGESRGFQELQMARPREAKRLIDGIVTKAQGVFLWVSVVVLALCEGLAEGDKLSELQAILDLLPTDLDKLYSSIWSGIKPAYISHSSQLFQIHHCATQPLNVVTLYLADDNDPLEIDIDDTRGDAGNHVIQMMKRRLNSRTRGLLEISGDGVVDYLHRSVHEWTVSNWSGIVSGAPDFDAHLAMLKALTVETSNPELWQNSRAALPTEFWLRASICLYHASKVRDDVSNIPYLSRVMDQLDKNLGDVSTSYTLGSGSYLALYRDISSPNLLSKANQELPHWASTQSTRTSTSLDNTFVGVAAQFAVLPYVRKKVSEDRGLVADHPGQLSVLACAIFGLSHFSRPDVADIAEHYTQSIEWAPRLQLVKFLLESGALRKSKKKSDKDSPREYHTYNQVLEKLKLVSSVSDADVAEVQYWVEVSELFGEAYQREQLNEAGGPRRSWSKAFKGLLGKQRRQ